MEDIEGLEMEELKGEKEECERKEKEEQESIEEFEESEERYPAYPDKRESVYRPPGESDENIGSVTIMQRMDFLLCMAKIKDIFRDHLIRYGDCFTFVGTRAFLEVLTANQNCDSVLLIKLDKEITAICRAHEESLKEKEEK